MITPTNEQRQSIHQDIEQLQHEHWLAEPATKAQLAKLSQARQTILEEAEQLAINCNGEIVRNKLIQALTINRTINAIISNVYLKVKS